MEGKEVELTPYSFARQIEKHEYNCLFNNILAPSKQCDLDI